MKQQKLLPNMLKNMKTTTKYYFYLLGYAIFFLCFCLFVFQLDIQNFHFPDSYSYLLACQELFWEGKFNDHRPILFSLLNGLPLLFTTKSDLIYSWSIVLNLLAWLGTIHLLFYILKSFLPIKIAFYASLFFVFCIGNVFINFHLLTESIYTFLLILLISQLIAFEKTKKIPNLIYVFSLLLLGCLIKPITLGLLYLALLFYLSYLPKLLQGCKSFVLYFSLLLFLAQLIGMKITYGNFTLSYIDGATYYNYLGTKADGYRIGETFEQGKNTRVLKNKSLSLMQMRQLAKKDFEEQIKNNKTNLFNAYLSNLYTNCTKVSTSVHGCKNVAATPYFDFFQFLFKGISKVENIILSTVGLIASCFVLLFFKQINRAMVFTACCIGYIIGVSAIGTDQGDRHHIIVFPLIIILGTLLLTKKQSNLYTPCNS